MFYDAMIDLGVETHKAKVMYYAVYLFGPKWVNLVPGENCGQNCIKNAAPSGVRFEGDQFGTAEFRTELERVKKLVENDKSISVEDLEKRAQAQRPADFFFTHGATYVHTGPDDPNIFAAR